MTVGGTRPSSRFASSSRSVSILPLDAPTTELHTTGRLMGRRPAGARSFTESIISRAVISRATDEEAAAAAWGAAVASSSSSSVEARGVAIVALRGRSGPGDACSDSSSSATASSAPAASVELPLEDGTRSMCRFGEPQDVNNLRSDEQAAAARSTRDGRRFISGDGFFSGGGGRGAGARRCVCSSGGNGKC